MRAELSTCAASARVLSLRGLSVDYGARCVLSGIDLDLAGTGTTVLLGPSGTGKSTLLRTVAGMTVDVPSAKVTGEVIYGVPGSNRSHGHRPPLVMQKASLLVATVLENLVQGWPERGRLTAAQQQTYVKQWLASLGQERLAEQLHLPVVGLPLPDQRLVSVLRGALLDAPLLLVDEPTAALTDRQAEPILALLHRLSQQRSLLVAMHHLGQSRAIADAVVLLASRRIQEHTAGKIFFTSPTSESGRLFLRSGSCPEEPLHHDVSAFIADTAAPVAREPSSREARQATAARPRTLGPNGFAWLIPGRLAGTPWPGLVHAAEYDFGLLQGLGVTRLLSLTDRSVDAPFAAAYGMKVANEPIVDMQPPGIDQAMKLCARIERWLADGDVVAVHCRAGLGRTGTVLGAFWIWQHGGRVAGAQALHDIRRLHPGWVQSASQTEFLHAFATAVARKKTGVPSRSATAKTAVPGV